VSAAPVRDGVVTVKGKYIVNVQPPGNSNIDIDLGNAAILPGLVNAHTHLDLSGMRGLAPPSSDFTGWLRQVIAHRRTRSPVQVRADIRTGLAECLRFGTTMLGDISSDGGSWNMLDPAPLRSVIFHELLGLTRERAEKAWLAAMKWYPSRQNNSTCRTGFSPHAPYSFRGERLPSLTASPFSHALAIHLAESPAELELLERHSGPFVPFLTELGVWDASGLAQSPEHVLRLTAKANPVLYVHGNYLAPDAPIPPHGSIVYCPRTHAAFGHPPHPFREFLARGVRVALGTDSLASNPDLDLLAEARFVHRKYPDVPGATLLRMATLAGAEALGWADETGSLESGKSADLVVLPLSNRDEDDPHKLIFDSDLPVWAVLWRGHWTHGDPEK
jgi:cytosine/adenosine deaminase-related metal-dependent hydrolase